MADDPTFDPISMTSTSTRRRRAAPRPPAAASLARTPPRAPKLSGAPIRGSIQSFARYLPGGMTTLISLVRMASETDPEAATFISKWDSQPVVARRNRTGQLIEGLCEELGMNWTRLLGWAAESAARTGQHFAAIKAALSLPEVVEKSIKFAKERKGIADRRMLFEHSRFIPVPAGAQVSILNQVAANAQSKNDSAGAFVPFESDIIEATDDGPPPQIRVADDAASQEGTKYLPPIEESDDDYDLDDSADFANPDDADRPQSSDLPCTPET